jgi:thiol-disulfide isomerase/thioredoxin
MVDVLVVTSPACHFCDDALETLAELARDYPLSIREVALESEEGRAVFERFRPPMPPFVVLDGELFSAGRLPRKKLRKRLDSVAVA